MTARTYTLTLALVLFALFGLAMLTGEKANASNYAEPSDVTLLTYAMLENGQQEAVIEAYQHLDGEPHIRHQMRKAGRVHCGKGNMQEDFTCK